MTRLLLLLLMMACIENLHAQSLLSNGSFEDRNTCAEFHVKCAPAGWFRIPLDAVSANRGTAGFLIGDHHENMVMENVIHPGIYRTYLYTRLLCPLEKDREYIFTASFRTPENQAISHVDLLWLGFEPFHFQTKITGSKQRNEITKDHKTGDQALGWKEYSIHFTATGEEQYLMIGNLSKDVFPGKTKQRSLIVYEIDNVKLLPADTSVKSCREIDENRQALYLHNYRHTPGKFVDEEDNPPKKPQPDIPKETVMPVIVPAPVVIPPVVNDTLVIPDVLFKFDKSELNPVFANKLDSLVDKIKNKTFRQIEILGHTDSLGNNAYNQRLSLSRAETVKNYLINRLHYASDIIVTKAFAATIPISTNTTSTGRQKNRRVEIVLIK